MAKPNLTSLWGNQDRTHEGAALMVHTETSLPQKGVGVETESGDRNRRGMMGGGCESVFLSIH